MTIIPDAMISTMQRPIRVLHVLHHIFHYPCGYRTRSENILRYQREQGIELSVVTACDHEGSRHLPVPSGLSLTTAPAYHGSRRAGLREWRLMRQLQPHIERAIDAVKPDVVHAHSPVLVAWPALSAARNRRKAFVYEVRDLWENAAVDLGKLRARSMSGRLARALDTHVLRRADAVTVICDSMRQEIAARLGSSERVFIANNGVDLGALRTEAREASRRRWNLPDVPVLGYVGTLQPYEGLELLIDALPILLQRKGGVHLLITGDGNDEAALRARVAQRGMGRHVTFTGRVIHEDVSHAYAACDVMVYPRRLTETTRLTTPLKPLEAMALGKAVVASDIPPMRELISSDVTGLLFKAGHEADLVAKVLSVLADAGLRLRLGAAGREWVTRERQWPTVVKPYHEAYATAMQRGNR
jgi:PEP-CTERM/exosortase A-associated glycosyltransferase